MNKRILIILLGSAVVAVGLFALWILGQPSSSERQVVVGPNQQATERASAAEREMTLYFASPEATQLVATTQRLACGDESDCLRRMVEALIRGPGADGLPVLPPQTHLLGVRTEEDLAILDFDSNLIDGHPGGSQSELLTAYALANSVAVNFSHLRQTSITVNGAAIDSLKGHVDLTRPLLADFTYTRRMTEADADKDKQE